MTLQGKYFSYNIRGICCCFTKSCLTLCDSMDCSPPVSSAQGISQARTLERVAVSPGDLPACPALAGGFFTTESARKPYLWHTYLKKSLVIWESSLAVHLEFYLATLSQTPALLTSVWSPLTGICLVLHWTPSIQNNALPHTGCWMNDFQGSLQV